MLRYGVSEVVSSLGLAIYVAGCKSSSILVQTSKGLFPSRWAGAYAILTSQ
jgi:hypothetical protein